MNIRPSICLFALLTATVASSQTYPSFPGIETDQRTLRAQERVEELYVSGAYDRAYFIYRNELAPRGDKFAQYMIGYMHLTGAGVAEDQAVALAWYRLAAERGETSLSTARDKLQETLSPEQVAFADDLFAKLNSELSDRVVVYKLVQKDLKILRDHAARGKGGSHSLVINRRYGHLSGAQYYQPIKNRLDARLNYLKSRGDDAPEAKDLAEIESEIEALIAEIDSRQ